MSMTRLVQSSMNPVLPVSIPGTDLSSLAQRDAGARMLLPSVNHLKVIGRSTDATPVDSAEANLISTQPKEERDAAVHG
jgi:hypothetical protein